MATRLMSTRVRARGSITPLLKIACAKLVTVIILYAVSLIAETLMTHDLLGKTFGRWTVIERAGSLRNMALWLCRCECGAEKKRTSTYLVGGRSGSCGCKRKKHGHASGGKLSMF